MKNMFIDIYEIEPGGIPVAADLGLGDRVDEDDILLEIGTTRIRGRAVPGPRGVDLRAHLESTARLRCSRCLEPFDWSVSVDFALILVPEATEFAAGEAQVTELDASLFYCPGGKADLAGIAMEQINLGLPLKPVCDPECRGLCATCGGNRNEIECGCREESIDPRLAPLMELKKKSRDGV